MSSYLIVRVPVEETEIHDGKAYIFCGPDHQSVVGPFDIARPPDAGTVTWAAGCHPGGSGATPPYGYTPPGGSGGSCNHLTRQGTESTEEST